MKLYAWDFPALDLSTLTGNVTLHGSDEYRCTVMSATSERAELVCNPMGELTLVRVGKTLVVTDKGGRGSDKLRALTLGGVS